jgi:signal peptidase
MKVVKTIINLIYYLIFFVLVLIAGAYLFTNPKIKTNFMLFAVETGSMSPKIPQGSIVLIQKRDSYQNGDVITFRDEGNPKSSVTHRVVDVSEDKDLGKISYRVRGDANEDPDPELVQSTRVLGRTVFSLPFVGYAVVFAKTQMGFILLIVVPATLIISSELGNIKNEITKKFRKASGPEGPRPGGAKIQDTDSETKDKESKYDESKGGG